MPATFRWKAPRRAPRRRGRADGPLAAAPTERTAAGSCAVPGESFRPSRRSTACAAAISSKAISRRHSSIIRAHLATTSGVCAAWSSTPSDTARKSSITGFASWRMAARIAVTVFCSGTKPADVPPTGDRYFGRPLRPDPVSWMKRAAHAAAACAMARPSVSKASDSAAVWKLPVDITTPSSANTSGLSPALSSSISTASGHDARRREARRGWTGRQRIDSGSCRVVGEGCASPSRSRRSFAAASWPNAGRAACSRGSRIGAVRAKSFHGQRSRLLGCGRGGKRVIGHQSAVTGGNGGGVDQRQPVLWRQLRRQPGRCKRLARRQATALGFRLALADQHPRQRRHQHQVAGADRAQRRHDRMHAGVQSPQPAPRKSRQRCRSRRRTALQRGKHHGADDLDRQADRRPRRCGLPEAAAGKRWRRR